MIYSDAWENACVCRVPVDFGLLGNARGMKPTFGPRECPAGVARALEFRLGSRSYRNYRMKRGVVWETKTAGPVEAAKYKQHACQNLGGPVMGRQWSTSAPGATEFATCS